MFFTCCSVTSCPTAALSVCTESLAASTVTSVELVPTFIAMSTWRPMTGSTCTLFHGDGLKARCLNFHGVVAGKHIGHCEVTAFVGFGVAVLARGTVMHRDLGVGRTTAPLGSVIVRSATTCPARMRSLQLQVSSNTTRAMRISSVFHAAVSSRSIPKPCAPKKVSDFRRPYLIEGLGNVSRGSSFDNTPFTELKAL